MSRRRRSIRRRLDVLQLSSYGSPHGRVSLSPVGASVVGPVLGLLQGARVPGFRRLSFPPCRVSRSHATQAPSGVVLPRGPEQARHTPPFLVVLPLGACGGRFSGHSWAPLTATWPVSWAHAQN